MYRDANNLPKTDSFWSLDEADRQATANAANMSYNAEPISKFGSTSGGLQFLNNNTDSYLNAVNQQALWDREDLLRKAAELREDYSMDRIVAAAKRNGINPIFLLDSLGGNTVGNAASYTTSAAKANNNDTNARTGQATSASIFGALIAALGLIIAHL